jgi:hypothetical protein
MRDPHTEFCFREVREAQNFVGWVKERSDKPTASKALGIAESTLRRVEGLNPSYVT